VIGSEPLQARIDNCGRPLKSICHRCETSVPLLLSNPSSQWPSEHCNVEVRLSQFGVSEEDRLSQHDADHVHAMVDELNTRPRKTLGWQTPHDVFWAATVALIAWSHSRNLISFGRRWHARDPMPQAGWQGQTSPRHRPASRSAPIPCRIGIHIGQSQPLSILSSPEDKHMRRRPHGN
jgi:hypothetical protein